VAAYSRRKEEDEAGEPKDRPAAREPDPRDDIDPLDLPEDEQVVYDLGAWPLAVHADVAEALATLGISHGWQGVDLVIHERHEDEVDAALEEIERRHGLGDDAEERRGPAREPGNEVEYDLGEWEESARALVTQQLTEADLGFRWEGRFLVVAADDESMVDVILDGAEDAIGAAPEGEVVEEDADGDSPMARLFVAVDSLASHPNDRDAILRLNALLERAEGAAAPFGVSPEAWDGILDDVSDLIDLALESEDSHDVKAEAIELRNSLRPLV